MRQLKIIVEKHHAGILDIHPVTAGRCAEKGKKLVDNYEEIWGALE